MPKTSERLLKTYSAWSLTVQQYLEITKKNIESTSDPEEIVQQWQASLNFFRSHLKSARQYITREGMKAGIPTDTFSKTEVAEIRARMKSAVVDED